MYFLSSRGVTKNFQRVTAECFCSLSCDKLFYVPLLKSAQATNALRELFPAKYWTFCTYFAETWLAVMQWPNFGCVLVTLNMYSSNHVCLSNVLLLVVSLVCMARDACLCIIINAAFILPYSGTPYQGTLNILSSETFPFVFLIDKHLEKLDFTSTETIKAY